MVHCLCKAAWLHENDIALAVYLLLLIVSSVQCLLIEHIHRASDKLLVLT